MAFQCPAKQLRLHLDNTKQDASLFFANASKYCGAGTTVRKVRRSVSGPIGGVALGIVAIGGGIVAARGALWLATGTCDNVAAIAAGFSGLHRRFFGRAATNDIRSAMEGIATCLVPSQEEEQEDADRVDAIASDHGGVVGSGSGADDDGAGGGPAGAGGVGGDAELGAVEPGAALNPEGARGDDGGKPQGSRSTRRGSKTAINFQIKNRSYSMSGVWARLAHNAKERFRSVEYDTYNNAALGRWLDVELRAMKDSVRTCDRLKYLRIIELFVWYVDEEEKDLMDAMEELKLLGLIRRRAD